jgi:hypothetical protein
VPRARFFPLRIGGLTLVQHLRAGLLALVFILGTGAGKPPAMDIRNPTCPEKVDWGQARAMSLTVADKGGKRVLIADGIIDARLPDRLKAAIEADERIEEVWLKSRGGDAEAGNRAGKVIRSYPGMVTRIPAGWTCFSSCNFVFMGGDRRFVDPGGVFMVHMFTHTGDRDVIEISVDEGTEETTRLIGEIEQASALLASEDNDFLIRMGISRKLLTEIMYKQQAVASKENPSTR